MTPSPRESYPLSNICIIILSQSQKLLSRWNNWNVWSEWSSALKIHELYDHLSSYGSSTIHLTWFQHGFHYNGPVRENVFKRINMGYLNKILNITYH